MPEGFQEWWLAPPDVPPREFAEKLKELRYLNNLKPVIQPTKALLQKQLADFQLHRKFLKTWNKEMTEDEGKEIQEIIELANKKLMAITLREIPGKAFDVSMSIVAGMKEVKESDFIDVCAQTLYWNIFRVSPWAGMGELSSMSCWNTAFQCLLYECTATGASNQKNKISLFTQEANDRAWYAIKGSDDLVQLYDFANGYELDTTFCIYYMSELLKAVYYGQKDYTVAIKNLKPFKQKRSYIQK